MYCGSEQVASSLLIRPADLALSLYVDNRSLRSQLLRSYKSLILFRQSTSKWRRSDVAEIRGPRNDFFDVFSGIAEMLYVWLCTYTQLISWSPSAWSLLSGWIAAPSCQRHPHNEISVKPASVFKTTLAFFADIVKALVGFERRC